MTISPSITDPVAQFIWHCIEGWSWPITLIVGSEWVAATDPYTYMVNADELASYEQVKAMLIAAKSVAILIRGLFGLKRSAPRGIL